MKRKKILVTATLAATALAGTFAFASSTNAAADWLEVLNFSPAAANRPANNSLIEKKLTILPAGEASEISVRPAQEKEEPADWVSYYFLFRFADHVKKEAEKAELEGRDAREYRQYFIQKAGLDEIQNQSFQEISQSCLSEVAEIDRLAEVIIARHRATLKILTPPAKGEPVPPAPAELLELEKRRDAVVLKHLDELKTKFGETKYVEFGQFVKRVIKTKTIAKKIGEKETK